MEAPPLQYTKTTDGYSIAYMTSGDGPIVVYMPQLYQHSQRLWAGGGFARTLRSLAQRFRLVQYDSRGQGMSQRGLPEPHSFAEYELDLAAVVCALGAERVALHAVGPFAHVAMRYAAEHPDRVAALVLQGTTVVSNLATLYTTEMLELAGSNWDLFLLMNARMGFPRSDSSAMVSYFQASANQVDLLKLIEVASQSSVMNIARRVAAPTLIWARAENPFQPNPVDSGPSLAQLIEGSRLVTRGFDLNARHGDTTEIALLVVSFLDQIGYTTEGHSKLDSPPGGLSPREVEVLRLIAAGKSNPQIADELVISLNTVQRHVSNILGKTGLANRTEAASFATRHGLV